MRAPSRGLGLVRLVVVRGRRLLVAYRAYFFQFVMVDAAVSHAGVFIFVILPLAIIAESSNIEVAVSHKWTLSHALMHEYVRCFEGLHGEMLIGRRVLPPTFVGGKRLRVFNQVGVQFVRLEHGVKALQVAATDHAPRVRLGVGEMHLLEGLVFLRHRQLRVCPDLIQLIGELHFIDQVLGSPIAGQAGQHRAVTGQDEHLDVMRSGAVGGRHGVAVSVMASGHAGVGLATDVVVAANHALQGGKGWILRERHGSQAIACTSSCAVDGAQDVEPKNHLAGPLSLSLGLSQRLVPVDLRVQTLNAFMGDLPRRL